MSCETEFASSSNQWEKGFRTLAGDLIMFYRYLIYVLQMRFDDSIKMRKNFSVGDFKINKLKKKNYCTQLSCEL